MNQWTCNRAGGSLGESLNKPMVGLYRVLLLSVCLLVSACGGGGGDGGSGSSSIRGCGVDAQKEFVRQTANSWYYWYDELADVNPADYASAQEYLDALTAPLAADSRDPGFSYLTTREADEARFSSGTYFGFGFRYAFIGDDFYFADAFEGSPAYIAGLRRGQRLLAIDLGNGEGFETWESLDARDAPSSEIFGPSDEAVTRIFRIESNGVTQYISITKAEIETPPIAGEPLLIEHPVSRRLAIFTSGVYHSLTRR